MRRNNLFKAGVLTLVLTLAIGMTACGKKNNTSKDTNTTAAQENVTVADKNNTNNSKKTNKVVFDYTDAEGNTSKLEGNATVNDNGEATIEVVDSNGNKAVFTGKANTDNGKLSVSDIKVKDAGTLVKTDGTEVKVSEGAKIEDATESTEETKADVAAKDEKKEDVIVADGGNSGSGTLENTGNENTGDNGAGSDNGNVSDTPSNEPDNKNENIPVVNPADTPTEKPDVPNDSPVDVPDEPADTPDVPGDNDNSDNGYGFSVEENLDGRMMYGVEYEDKKMRGRDIIQGEDVECPYELKVVTARKFYVDESESFSVREGYYYIGLDRYGSECENDFNDLSYQMGKYNCRCARVGVFSCGTVWFCAFDD